jgi:CRISPR-associated protein Csx3
MAGTYKIEAKSVAVGGAAATLLSVGFGSPAQNDVIVREASARLEELSLPGGALVLINGPASLPVAVVLAHGLLHRFGAVGVFDPKLGAYVVAASHDPARPLGSLIPGSEVKDA